MTKSLRHFGWASGAIVAATLFITYAGSGNAFAADPCYGFTKNFTAQAIPLGVGVIQSASSQQIAKADDFFISPVMDMAAAKKTILGFEGTTPPTVGTFFLSSQAAFPIDKALTSKQQGEMITSGAGSTSPPNVLGQTTVVSFQAAQIQIAGARTDFFQ